MKGHLALLILFCLGSIVLPAQVEDTTIQTPLTPSYTATLFAGEIDIPWGMAFLPDGSMLVTEIKGTLFHIENGKKKVVSGVPAVLARGQGGLLDVVLHPQYEKNQWVYLSYSEPGSEENTANTAIIRARFNGSALTDTSVIYRGIPTTSRAYHYGSRICFDKEGYLYFTIGDRGDHFVNPQDLTRDGGKVYRIKDDGTIPVDNPFYNMEDARKAIYSFGHRNPQGMVMHPETGQIWAHEHGPQGGDEINIIERGANFGWPVISYGINYDNTILTDQTKMEGMKQPIYYYKPSIAPSGMAFVSSDRYPEWKGNLLIGSLRFQYLERVVLKDNQVVYREKILPDEGRVRDVRLAPDGFIYVAVEGKGIYKIIPKAKK
jgi:glucose/arabinose dehydrogenase